MKRIFGNILYYYGIFSFGMVPVAVLTIFFDGRGEAVNRSLVYVLVMLPVSYVIFWLGKRIRRKTAHVPFQSYHGWLLGGAFCLFAAFVFPSLGNASAGVTFGAIGVSCLMSARAAYKKRVIGTDDPNNQDSGIAIQQESELTAITESQDLIVYTVFEPEPGEKAFWLPVGSAWTAQDGSINVELNVCHVNGRLNIRPGMLNEK